MPIDPKTPSRGYGEYKCLSMVGHVTGDEK